jgi:RNA polymerase sigma-70 factor, ECF subfamily
MRKNSYLVPHAPVEPHLTKGYFEFNLPAYGKRVETPHLFKVTPIREVTTLRNQTILLPGMTEAEVIDRAKLGDDRCFEALYAQHKRRVFSLCLRMTGDRERAEDFTQEAFLQLFRKITSFRGDSAFSTWLHRLTVNIVLMQFRKKILAGVSLDETVDHRQDDKAFQREIATRDDMLHGSIDRINLERAVEDLPPGYRMIFVLHDVEGYEHNEIAEMLGCSIGNSKSQLFKARVKLRTWLITTGEGEQRRSKVAA